MRKLLLCFMFIIATASYVFAMPTNPYPMDGQIDIPVDVVLSWESDNIGGDYFLYFGDDPDSMPMVDSGSYDVSGTGIYPTMTLQYDTVYYWSVTDCFDFSCYIGPTWSFMTTSSTSPAIPAPAAVMLGGIGTVCVGFLRRKRSL